MLDESGENNPGSTAEAGENNPGSTAEAEEKNLVAVSHQSRCSLRMVLFYSVVCLSVLVPDLVMVFVYSAVLLGPDVYDNFATDDKSNMFGNMTVAASIAWLMLLFVFDMFNSTIRSRGIWAVFQLVGLVILVALVFAGVTLKAMSYPWVPLFLCMSTTVLFLAFKRDQWRETSVSLPHFYAATAACYSIGAVVMMAIWIVWMLNAKSWHLWWNRDTQDWLADVNSKVYSQAYDKPLDHPLYWYCSDDDNLKGIADHIVKDKVSSACTKASTVCFIQWAGPLTVFLCNVLAAGFCMLFSATIAKFQPHGLGAAEERKCKKKALFTFMKRFLLTIVLAIAMMYTSLYVSGAAAKLGSAMLALAAFSVFIMFLWMCREVDTQTLNDFKDEMPALQNIINVLQSNWVRAIAVGALNITIPLIALLDRTRQKVRISTGVYKNNPNMDPKKTEEKELHTSQGKRLFDSLELWDWTDIFGKVCVLGEIGVLMVVGSKATFIFFSYLNRVIGQSGMEIGSIAVMVWVIGLGMFMNPIVPGTAVYLFAGVVIGAQSQKEGSIGIWAGWALGSIVGAVAKLLACMGQYFIGYRAGKSVKVQQFVGVTKVATLASESVLKEKGFKLFKVCILVAGPDFPTSMLCGILGLNVPQMLLGTSPVILVSTIPQTLVGVLLTKEGGGDAEAGVWVMISTIATGFAALVQAGATLIFSYGIMKTIEEKGEKLKEQAAKRPEFAQVRALDEEEAGYVQKFKEVARWKRLPGEEHIITPPLGTRPKCVLLGAVALFLLSGFLMAVDFIASEKICFRKFSITSEIGASYPMGGLQNNVFNAVHAPVGWIALGMAFLAVVLHISFGKWLKRTARDAYECDKNKNDKNKNMNPPEAEGPMRPKEGGHAGSEVPQTLPNGHVLDPDVTAATDADGHRESVS